MIDDWQTTNDCQNTNQDKQIMAQICHRHKQLRANLKLFKKNW